MVETVKSSGFLVSVMGEIEKAYIQDIDNIYVKYCFVYGKDWDVTSGIEEGISQISKHTAGCPQFVWNFPIEIVFKSNNPHGWPQLILCVYGLDGFGNDVIRGYGLCHLPISSGTTAKQVRLFVPQSSSSVQKFTSWLTGHRPEYIDPKILTMGDGREVTRTKSEGIVFVKFNILTKDLYTHGFDNNSRIQRINMD
ncbi:hypothetical protein M8J76_008702 [Diaphorina citri]|nr:hypothetical protein M8J76_008702 [Diaphorina citri]KAI5752602.1 hypothetical protein M8J77_018534 [Diaphorina citri]